MGFLPPLCHFLTAALAEAAGGADEVTGATAETAADADAVAVTTAEGTAMAAASGATAASGAAAVAVAASASALPVDASQASKQSADAVIASNDVFIFFSWLVLMFVMIRAVPFIYHILEDMYKFFHSGKNLVELH